MKNLLITILLIPLNIFGQELSFNDNGLVTDGTVSCIRSYGDSVAIGGTFNYIGLHTGGLVKVDTSNGSIISGLPKFYGQVNCIIGDGNNGYFVGGNFNKVGTTAIQNLAHINSNNSIDLSFQPNPNGSIGSIVLKGTTVYVSGSFTQIGGTSRNSFAEINRNTGIATSWNPNPSPSASSGPLAISGNILFVGGSFTNISSTSRNYLAAFDTSTNNLITSFNPSPNGSISNIIVNGNRIYIQGNFTTISSVSRNQIASLNLSGTLLNFNPSPVSSANITSIAPYQNTVFVGYVCSYSPASFIPFINQYDSVNGTITSWTSNASFGNYVGIKGIINNKLIVTGTQISNGTVNKNYYALIDATTGNLKTNWTDNANNYINCSFLQNGSLILGGTFSSIGGYQRSCVAIFSSLTNLIYPFNPNISPTGIGWNRTINSIDVRPNGIFAVGKEVNTPNSQGRIWLFYNNGSVAKQINTYLSSAANGTEVTALKFINNYVYVAGIFDQIGTTTGRVRAAKMDTSLTTISFFPGPGNTNSTDDAQVRIYEINNDTNGNIIFTGGKVFNVLGGTTVSTFYPIYLLSNTGTFIRSLTSGSIMQYFYKTKITGDTIYSFYNTTSGSFRSSLISNNTNMGSYFSASGTTIGTFEIWNNSLLYTLSNPSNSTTTLNQLWKGSLSASSVIYDTLDNVGSLNVNSSLIVNNKIFITGTNFNRPNDNVRTGLVSYSVFENRPTVNSSSLSISSITNNSVNLTWTNGNGIGRIVVARLLTTTNQNPVSGSTYTANSVFGSGSITGSGNYVVYNGTSNTVAVTGLSSSQTYQFSVYEYNGSGQTINYFATPCTGNATTLPVTLFDFTAKKQYENKIQLNWSTASEINNDYFEIDKSTNNLDWNSIGKVKGKGTTNSVSNYNFIDDISTSLDKANVLYYRLKQFDFDGKNSLSDVRVVNLNEVNNEIIIYPNPTNNVLNISFALQSSSVIINLCDITGRIVKNVNPSNNNTQIDVNDLCNGIYFINISGQEINVMRKIIINK